MEVCLTYLLCGCYYFFMIKRLLCILSMLITLPAFCGEFEEAARTHNKIFLYLYTKDCGYCVKFDPVYKKISQIYGANCKFLKINADSEYGTSLMRSLNAYYVPFVVVIDNDKRVAHSISPTCLLSYSCTQDKMNKFVN